MACRKEEYAQVLQNTHGAKITSWWDRAVDIIPVSGGKGTGIAKMLEYYGIDRPWLLGMETTTLKCSRRWIWELPWRMHPTT